MSLASPYPILQFDPDRDAIINPPAARFETELPERAVLCFFREVLDELAAGGQLRQVARLRSEMGDNPIYILEHQGCQITVMHPGVGAPLAAGFLEELVANNVRRFIACGGCGALKPDIVAGHAVILTGAVRDEGTSYHYLPAGAPAQPSPAAVAALKNTFEQNDVPYCLSRSWTTDGLYRETCAKRRVRLAEGCDVVEMEAAAFFAVAEFRRVTLGQVVYGGDLVVPEGWDNRNWDKRITTRQQLFWLAVQACAQL